MPRLLIEPGQPAERVSILPEGRSIIGRADDSAICIPHTSLSRRHAELTICGGQATVTDLRSKNGTFVNSARIQSSELKPGDCLRCGEVTLVFDPPDIASFLHRPKLALPLPEGDPAAALSGMLAAQRSDREVTEGLVQDPVERLKRKLDMLLRIAQLLTTPDAMSELQSMVVDLAFQVFDIDSAVLLFVNRASRLLEPRLARMKEAPRPDETMFSRSVAEYVRRERVGVVFGRAAEDPRVAGAPSIQGQSIQAAMCAPLRPRDEVIGVLYVDNRRQVDPFSEEDLSFLIAFANQVGIAVENADLFERLKSEAVRHNNLRRFFPPSTLRGIEQGLDGVLRTVNVPVTVLFCDIADFTTIAGEMDPGDVVTLLNEFFAAMTDVIFKFDGTLEKYIGDALLAVWGAPFGRPDDADRALATAVELQRTLAHLNERWREEGRRTLKIHLGLSSGRVAAGNVGTGSYLQYATIGEPTNMASRICACARGGEILLSSTTRDLLRSDHGPMIDLGPVVLKGRKDPMTLFRLAWEESPIEPITITAPDGPAVP